MRETLEGRIQVYNGTTSAIRAYRRQPLTSVVDTLLLLDKGSLVFAARLHNCIQSAFFQCCVLERRVYWLCTLKEHTPVKRYLLWSCTLYFTTWALCRLLVSIFRRVTNIGLVGRSAVSYTLVLCLVHLRVQMWLSRRWTGRLKRMAFWVECGRRQNNCKHCSICRTRRCAKQGVVCIVVLLCGLHAFLVALCVQCWDKLVLKTGCLVVKWPYVYVKANKRAC